MGRVAANWTRIYLFPSQFQK